MVPVLPQQILIKQDTLMKKTILTFGLISGAVSSLMMICTVPFAHRIGFEKGLVIGYTSMVLSFLLVYFGIRSYRDNVASGHITFTKALAVGMCIMLISCVCYVVTWEIIYYNFMPDFIDSYNAHAIERFRASGASDAAIAAKIQELNKFKEMYKNPLVNIAMTFIEPFPVGLVITVLSAAILRRKPPSNPLPSPVGA
jgi:hypothetical protein